ncbi:MAG: glycosyltransferase family 2 protein [Candidatus Diapherotrites archaeon]|nr:glycosyltransferase family 2 protein [Candidatus Diapherotrites archaeon]
MKLGILILAYQAEDTIASVLARIPEETFRAAEGIYIFDDASTDRTSDVACACARTHAFRNKIHVHTNPKNLGYGGNQKHAYRFALKNGLEAVVMVHGDGQYAPELLSQIYSPIMRGEADLVFGSRMTGNPLRGKMPLHKFIGNQALTQIQNLLVGSRFSEFHSGYRAFRTRCFQDIPLSECTSGFHFDTQILILFFDRHFRIHEVSIPTFYGDEISRVRIVSYGLRVIGEALKYWALRRAPFPIPGMVNDLYQSPQIANGRQE